jgi:Zn-dependent peptidase ImmA (M78 family)
MLREKVIMTEDEVRQIRKEYIGREESATAVNIIELAKRYGVSQEMIRKVAKRRLYKWVRD